MVRFLCLSMMLLVGACHRWSAPQAPSPEIIQGSSRPVRVVRTDGWAVELRDVAIVGDSVIGISAQPPHQRIAIASAEIQSVSVRTVDAGRSIGLGLGIVAGLAAVALLALVIIIGSNSY